MEHKVDVQVLLSAFQKIRDYGQKTNDGFELEGVEAISSIDGYNLTMKDGHASLFLHFHNTYNFESDSLEHSEALLHQIEEIDRNF